MKLLYKFQKKYGKIIKREVYEDHVYFCFKGDRWVCVDRTGEMSWDGKENEFNIFVR